MNSQTLSFCKAFFTEFTFQRLLTSVLPHVLDKGSRTMESLVAILTLMHPLRFCHDVSIWNILNYQVDMTAK